MMRVGAVSFTNAVPLTRGLERHLPGAHVVRMTPARIADALAGGSLDLGLVPVVALAAHPEWSVLPGLGIAAQGPVRSVLLLSRVPPERITRLVLDPASRTSNQLARLWLKHRAQVEPEVLPGPPELLARLDCGEATVAIGDDALFWTEQIAWSLDLGGAWTEWTGLPFVFAVWAGPEANGPEITRAFERCYVENASRLVALAEETAPHDAFRQELLRGYWSRSIRYRLGRGEEEGLRTYLALGAEAGYFEAAGEGALHVQGT
jgi:chorismate dehydratase